MSPAVLYSFPFQDGFGLSSCTLNYTIPHKLSIDLEFACDNEWNGFDNVSIFKGPSLFAEIGAGAGSIGIGYTHKKLSHYVLSRGVSVRLGYLQTWDDPVDVEKHNSFVGVEFKGMFPMGAVKLGFYRNTSVAAEEENKGFMMISFGIGI